MFVPVEELDISLAPQARDYGFDAHLGRQFSMRKEKDMQDVMKEFEVEKAKLIARGATGLSIFLDVGRKVSMKDYAKDTISFMKLMTPENTRSPEEVEKDLANRGL